MTKLEQSTPEVLVVLLQIGRCQQRHPCSESLFCRVVEMSVDEEQLSRARLRQLGVRSSTVLHSW